MVPLVVCSEVAESHRGSTFKMKVWELEAAVACSGCMGLLYGDLNGSSELLGKLWTFSKLGAHSKLSFLQRAQRVLELPSWCRLLWKCFDRQLPIQSSAISFTPVK